jgi:hypothetical protein
VTRWGFFHLHIGSRTYSIQGSVYKTLMRLCTSCVRRGWMSLCLLPIHSSLPRWARLTLALVYCTSGVLRPAPAVSRAWEDAQVAEASTPTHSSHTPRSRLFSSPHSIVEQPPGNGASGTTRWYIRQEARPTAAMFHAPSAIVAQQWHSFLAVEFARFRWGADKENELWLLHKAIETWILSKISTYDRMQYFMNGACSDSYNSSICYYKTKLHL